MKLFNPTNDSIKVRIFGVDYSVEPKSTTVELEEDVANYWLTLHAFLTKDEQKVEVEKEVIEKKTKVNKEK